MELLGVCFGDLASYEIIDQRRESNQTQKPPVPTGIEHIGRDQKQQILEPQPAFRCRPAVHRPIQGKDRDDEGQKFDGIEEHLGGMGTAVRAQIACFYFCNSRDE